MIFGSVYETEGADHPRAKRAISDFLKSGPKGEAHSARGLLLHHVCNYCVANGIGFELEFIPVENRYVIRRRGV